MDMLLNIIVAFSRLITLTLDCSTGLMMSLAEPLRLVAEVHLPESLNVKSLHWTATGDRLLDLCEQILPYLVIKKEQCELMIKFRKTYTGRLGSNKVSVEALAIRQSCLEDIRKLNSRWHLHPIKHKFKI